MYHFNYIFLNPGSKDMFSDIKKENKGDKKRNDE